MDRARFLSLFGFRLPSHRQKIEGLKKLFAEIDARISSFQMKTGLTCAERCGSCCESPHIETTELEMLPLGEELVRNGQAEAWYAQAEKQGFQGQCVFYAATPSDKMNGCCQVYGLRPLICRLFAFAGNRDKYNRVRLVTCKVIKGAQPVLAEKALADVAAGRVIPPVMADLMMRAAALDPELSRESLPINTAFRKAVERLWLYERLNSQKN